MSNQGHALGALHSTVTFHSACVAMSMVERARRPFFSRVEIFEASTLAVVVKATNGIVMFVSTPWGLVGM